VRGIAAYQPALVAPNAALDLGSNAGVFPSEWCHSEVLLLDDRRTIVLIRFGSMQLQLKMKNFFRT
jgi:hypothetical protein